jgi:hypothetical protein
MADKGLTDAEAGVDIDAGDRMVDLIKPLEAVGGDAPHVAFRGHLDLAG